MILSTASSKLFSSFTIISPSLVTFGVNIFTTPWATLKAYIFFIYAYILWPPYGNFHTLALSSQGGKPGIAIFTTVSTAGSLSSNPHSRLDKTPYLIFPSSIDIISLVKVESGRSRKDAIPAYWPVSPSVALSRKSQGRNLQF